MNKTIRTVFLRSNLRRRAVGAILPAVYSDYQGSDTLRHSSLDEAATEHF